MRGLRLSWLENGPWERDGRPLTLTCKLSQKCIILSLASDRDWLESEQSANELAPPGIYSGAGVTATALRWQASTQSMADWRNR